MGARSNYETIAQVLQAFTVQNTWRQAELAERVGIQSRTLRKILAQLSDSGMPLESEEEHPHVTWSVRKGWFPGGVVFDQKDWFVLVDAVARVPDVERRARLLERLVAGNQGKQDAVSRVSAAISATTLDTEQHAHYLTLQRAIIERSAIEMKYYSYTTGRTEWRFITPHRLGEQPHVRVVAYCHRHGELRWFRLSNIQRAELTTKEDFRDWPADGIDAFVATSVDGYRDGSGEALEFTVRFPEGAWVRDNLLPGMSAAVTEDGKGVLVSATGAPLVVARFVVGLGGAARAGTPELRALVREVAEAALAANP